MRGAHIAVDARMATDGGIGTYLQALIPRIAALRPDWRLTLLGDVAKMQSLGWGALGNTRLEPCGAAIFSVQEQVELARRFPHDANLYWAPHYNVPVLGSNRPMVVTIHDLCHLALPDLMGGRLRQRYARWLLTSAVRRARAVIFDSDFTRREAHRLLARAHESESVVHLAVEDDWANSGPRAPRPPVSEPYFLYVGNIKRHKNLPLLLRAFARVKDRLPHRLVLIGRQQGLRADPAVFDEIARLGNRVIALGEATPETVRQYVTHATALVTVSLYEGFGLPPLEAMAAGCPCVVSTAGSLPEVCGDAALYCDPRDEASIAGRLLEVTNGLDRAALIERGRQRARAFSWDRSAGATVDILERALA